MDELEPPDLRRKQIDYLATILDCLEQNLHLGEPYGPALKQARLDLLSDPRNLESYTVGKVSERNFQRYGRLFSTFSKINSECQLKSSPHYSESARTAFDNDFEKVFHRMYCSVHNCNR